MNLFRSRLDDKGPYATDHYLLPGVIFAVAAEPLTHFSFKQQDLSVQLFEEVYSDYRSRIAPDLERLASRPAEGGRATPSSAPAAP